MLKIQNSAYIFLMGMDIYSELRQFLTLVEEGSITAAARSLGQTQSALTKSLKRLEESLGVKLLERLPRGVRLTPDGQRVYARARAVEAEMRYLALEAGFIRKDIQKCLKVGSIPFWNVTSVPHIVNQFSEMHPEVSLVVTVDSQEHLMEDLRTGGLDFALCGIGAEAHDPAIGCESLLRVDLAVACSSSHPLLASWTGNENEFLQYDWIDYRSTLGSSLNSVRRERIVDQLHLQASVQTNSWLGGLLLAAHGTYLMALPLQLEPFLKSLGLAFVPNSPILLSSETGIWYRKSVIDTNIGRVFRSLARRQMLRYGKVTQTAS